VDNLTSILGAIGSTEASTFNEFCSGLGKHCPAKKDTPAWREIFSTLDQLALEEDVIIIRDDEKKIVTLQLTPKGADKARRALDSSRSLLTAMMGEQ
jgi:hypothetical protein